MQIVGFLNKMSLLQAGLCCEEVVFAIEILIAFDIYIFEHDENILLHLKTSRTI